MTLDDIDEIQASGIDQHFAYFKTFFQTQTAVKLFVQCFIKNHTDSNDVRTADLFTDFLQNFQSKAGSIFQTAAVAIIAEISSWRPKRIQKMSVSFNFNSVQTTLLTSFCGGAVGFYYSADVRFLSNFRKTPMRWFTHTGRSHNR